MATLQFNIPDAAVPRVLDAFANRFSYEPTITQEDGSVVPNPETRVEFTRRMVREFIVQTVLDHESRQAAQIAVESKQAEIRDQVQVT